MKLKKEKGITLIVNWPNCESYTAEVKKPYTPSIPLDSVHIDSYISALYLSSI